MAIIMNENKVKIHANSGKIFENDREVGEDVYEFLRFQLDEVKKQFRQYSNTLEVLKVSKIN